MRGIELDRNIVWLILVPYFRRSSFTFVARCVTICQKLIYFRSNVFVYRAQILRQDERER